MIDLDLHGMTVNEAKKVIEKTIAALDNKTKELRLIHGYHSGDALKEFVRSPNGIRSKRLKRKKYTMNQGETILELY